MADTPWLGDACSLVDAFRSGIRSPAEELDLVIGAIERSDLNAFCHLDLERAAAAAETADVSLPFGGVPIGVKELEPVTGWPLNEASLVFGDRVAEFDGTMYRRLVAAGIVPVGQTTSSEFGGLNISVSRRHGVTRNPWNPARTTGGSSAGSAAAVAGGLVPIATGGDGGGSIRIPASFCGLLGMKGTVGRIPRGPRVHIGPQTVVLGCMARSVRDVARWYDVCAGYDGHDPYSLPRIDGWERGVGTYRDALMGKRAAIAPTLGSAVVRPEVEAVVREAAAALIADAGLVLVDVDVTLPGLAIEWAMQNLATLRAELGDRWPACKDDMTVEIAFGMSLAEQMVNFELAASVEEHRMQANEAMGDVFDQVDFVFAATNPDVAFAADLALNTGVGDVAVGPENNGALTIPANACGNPAVSIPAGVVEGLPVGLQVIGRHHEDALLLDLARIVEQERPWPLVAAGSPR